jgi:glycosyltransferase involved in cell wall biosynthesis
MTTRRIRILQLQPECHERSHDRTDLAEQIVSAFPRARFEVTSAFLQGRPGPSHPQSCAEHTHYFELPDNALRGARFRLVWELFRFCKQGRFDVVICNRYKPVSAIMTIHRWLDIPLCIGISHGFGEYKTFWRRLFARLKNNAAWQFVGVSPAVRDHLVALNCGFTSKNTSAITNALDIDEVELQQLSREEARTELGLPLNIRLIGAIGRLVPVKGHVYLIQAFARIHEQFPDAHLAIIGEGREEAFLRDEIQRYGIEKKVHLLGWKTRAKKYVQAFDIWTMPSLQEGLGLALLEGMSGHLPVIASDVPAMRPLIDGAGGIRVAPADVDALTEALASYLAMTDEELRKKGEIAYGYLRRNHGVEEYRQAYLSLVDTFLKERTA